MCKHTHTHTVGHPHTHTHTHSITYTYSAHTHTHTQIHSQSCISFSMPFPFCCWRWPSLLFLSAFGTFESDSQWRQQAGHIEPDIGRAGRTGWTGNMPSKRDTLRCIWILSETRCWNIQTVNVWAWIRQTPNPSLYIYIVYAIFISYSMCVCVCALCADTRSSHTWNANYTQLFE